MRRRDVRQDDRPELVKPAPQQAGRSSLTDEILASSTTQTQLHRRAGDCVVLKPVSLNVGSSFQPERSCTFSKDYDAIKRRVSDQDNNNGAGTDLPAVDQPMAGADMRRAALVRSCRSISDGAIASPASCEAAWRRLRLKHPEGDGGDPAWLEIGLTPMQALQSIAVINGKPTIWGDAASR